MGAARAAPSPPRWPAGTGSGINFTHSQVPTERGLCRSVATPIVS